MKHFFESANQNDFIIVSDVMNVSTNPRNVIREISTYIHGIYEMGNKTQVATRVYLNPNDILQLAQKIREIENEEVDQDVINHLRAKQDEDLPW